MLLGLRPEWMRITSRLYGLDSVVTTDYWMAYPTLHVSYAIDDRRELRLNYSLRVNRPEADALNPFPEYQNPLTLRVGNPYLKPEKIHSVEAGYQWKKGGTTILGTLYYRSQGRCGVERFAECQFCPVQEHFAANQQPLPVPLVAGAGQERGRVFHGHRRQV